MPATANGRLIVISGPSGAGKSTVLRRVFQCCSLPLTASISATTRPPRPGEIDGRDYHFLTDEEFQLRRQKGEFLECFEVFAKGRWYGTLQGEVASGLQAGKWVVLEIDVQGALAVMRQYPDAIAIFIRPGSVEQLEQRLRGRGTETPESIRGRLQHAEGELALAEKYSYQVINDDVEQAVEEICHILTQENILTQESEAD